MSIPFPSDEWIKVLREELNQSKAYQEAAKNWEGDLCFVIKPGGSLKEEKFLYMDLWHGECRDAYEITNAAEADKAEFKIEAPLPTWRRVIEGQIDPIRGLMNRQLKLKGNMLKIMKSPKAAVELVNCSKTLDTEWP